MDVSNTGLAPTLRLQYRHTWQDPWVTDIGTVAIGKWKKGSGNQVGGCDLASWETPDTTGQNGAREALGTPCPLRSGDFARVIEVNRATNGKVTVPDTPVVHWTGYLQGRNFEQLGRQSQEDEFQLGYDLRRVKWTALGLGGLLAGIDLFRSWGVGSGAGQPKGLMGPLVFTPGRIRNRPSDVATAYQIGFHSKSDPWDARALIEGVMMWHLYEPGSSGPGSPRYPNWPVFQLTGLTDMLAYEVRDVMATGNLIDLLVALINPRRGATMVFEEPLPSDAPSGPVNIRILSMLTNPVTITIPASEGGGTLTLPASNRQIDTLTTSAPHRRVTVNQETLGRRLTVLGEKGAIAILNLRWSRNGSGVETGQLIRGGSWKPTDDNTTLSESPKFSDIWRTFTINPNWDGTITTGSLATGANTLGTNDSVHPLYGAGGLSGTRTIGGIFAPANVTLLDHLPLPSAAIDPSGNKVDLVTWMGAPTASRLDFLAPPLRPRVWAHDRTSNVWTELQVQIAMTGPCTIQLGSTFQDAYKIKGALSASNNVDLVILCAVVEPQAFAVSYEPKTPGATDPPIAGDQLRRCPWAEYTWIAADTCVGMTPTKLPVKSPAMVQVRDDTALLQLSLGLMRPRGERSSEIVVMDNLSLNSLPEVGSLLTQFDVGGDGTYIPVGYVVTSVESDPTPGSFGQKITCALPEIEMEAII